MFKLPFNKLKKAVVVVEIGNDWLKVLENKPFASGKQITKTSFTKLAQIKESVPDTILKIFSELKLDKQAVIIYIPRHLATVRILELPSTDPKEIADMVNLQVSKQTPYTKEEIVYTHKIVGSEREGYTRVMLAIARRAIINERIETLSQAGIEVTKVALSSEGVYSWFSRNYLPGLQLENSQAIVLIDIDSNYSDFIVINKKEFISTRSILIGLNHLRGEPDKWHDKFIEELKHSIELYQAKKSGIKIAKIFLSGAGNNIKDLEYTLSTRLDIPAQATDPLKNIQIKKSSNVLSAASLEFISISALIGVAIKHKELALDLTPGELQIQ